MRVLLTLTTILISSLSVAASPKRTCPLDPIKIAVIDTGFGYKNLGHDVPLCKYGHKNFTIETAVTHAYGTAAPVPIDTHGHGTNVVGLIHEYASKGIRPYCLVIIKYYSDRQAGPENVAASIKALEYANSLKVDFLNYSGGGPNSTPQEAASVQEMLDHGTHIVAAAGNEGREVDGVLYTYYPAMYDRRITVVGNKDIYGIRHISSNFGKFVTVWENGVDQTVYGITMTGTSQATAITTGKMVGALKTCDR